MANTFKEIGDVRTKGVMKASAHAASVSNLGHIVSELMNGKFYGKIVIIFENGKIVHGKKTESIII